MPPQSFCQVYYLGYILESRGTLPNGPMTVLFHHSDFSGTRISYGFLGGSDISQG